MEKEELLKWMKSNKTELLITSGAGDIDTLVEPIKEIILNRSLNKSKINIKNVLLGIMWCCIGVLACCCINGCSGKKKNEKPAMG